MPRLPFDILRCLCQIIMGHCSDNQGLGILDSLRIDGPCSADIGKSFVDRTCAVLDCLGALNVGPVLRPGHRCDLHR